MNRKHNPWASLIALLLLAVVLVLICTGCDSTQKAYERIEDAPKMMTVVDETVGYSIYRHDETGVHYFCRDGGNGKAVCVMLNPDGTPYTGTEE